MAKDARSRFVARLRRLAAEAKEEGIVLVADAESSSGGIRVMTKEESEVDDLRGVGIYVPLHEGCGGRGSDKSGGGFWM